jgi:hypothetical protein
MLWLQKSRIHHDRFMQERNLCINLTKSFVLQTWPIHISTSKNAKTMKKLNEQEKVPKKVAFFNQSQQIFILFKLVSSF